MKVNLFEKILLKLITELQKIFIKSDNVDTYFMLTNLHFKIYFKKNLIEEVLIDSEEFNMAAERHASMVLLNIYKQKEKNKSNIIKYKLAKASFRKHLLLQIAI